MSSDHIVRINAGDNGRRLPDLDAALLDYFELRRETLIRELRHVDDVLIAAGRLRFATLPKRAR